MDINFTEITAILEKGDRSAEDKDKLYGHLLFLCDLRQYLFDLPERQHDQLLSSLCLRHIPAGEFIFHKGDPSDFLYTVLSGTVGMYDCVGTHLSFMAELGPGRIFGERGLVRKAPRLFASKALTDVSVICLAASEFKALLEPAFHTRTEEKLGFIDRYLPGAKNVLMTSKERLAYAFSMQYCPRGRRLAHQGRLLDALYFVKSGEFTVSESRNGSIHTLVRLGAGSLFGDDCVLLGRACPYNIDCTAEAAWLYIIAREDALKFIPEAVLDSMRKQCVLKAEARTSLAEKYGPQEEERKDGGRFSLANPAAKKNIVTVQRRCPSTQIFPHSDSERQELRLDLSHFTPQATGEVGHDWEHKARHKKMRRTFD